MNIEFHGSATARSDGEFLVKYLSELLNEFHPWIKASWKLVPLPDSVNLADKLEPAKKKYIFPLACPTTDFLMARAGAGPPKHKYDREYTDMMFVGTIHRWGWTFLTPYPELAREPRKLAGRTVGVVNAPESEHWGSPTVLTNAILRDAWDIYDKVKKIQVIAPDVGKAFAANEADAIFWGRADDCSGKFTTAAPFFGLLKEKQYYWIPLSQADVDKINATNVWKIRLINVPKGSVSLPGPPPKTVNPPEDVAMADFSGALTAWADTDDEVIYELLKFIVDNANKFEEAKVHISPDLMSLSQFPGLTPDMVHPGAMRYYREQGIEIGK